jgi:ribose 5-phosphate isomerase A
VPFGWQTVLERLCGLRARPVLRRVGEAPFVTDGGNYIADCAFSVIPDAAALERQLAAVIGVVESGLFIGRADTVIIGRPSGVEILGK